MNIDIKKLLALNNELIQENKNLKEENSLLKQQIEKLTNKETPVTTQQELIIIKSNLNPEEKIKIFMNLFKGRNDVYAKRWENKKGQSGYSPVCLNEWKSGICRKPQIKCNECSYKLYGILDEKVIESHLKGEIVAGIYPLCNDENCYFLAIDFDEGEWQDDIRALLTVSKEYEIPLSIERSRSGNGAHAWIFFQNPVQASIARKLGSAVLTNAMTKRHEITFKSYDRLFPNQDIMPKGRLGNLIALPLQRIARNDNNSVFIDSDFNPYPDQWEYLSKIKKISDEKLKDIISMLCRGSELGVLRIDEEENEKPWESTKPDIKNTDFAGEIEIIKSNMFYIKKSNISQKGLNHLKRVAAFKNPEFYKAQAMRLPTYDKPRIISCSEETKDYLCLPRGCETDIKELFQRLNIKSNFVDKTNKGIQIDVDFIGDLRDDQPVALKELLKHNTGILSGTTAFGKTVVAIKLIAERKVNTLILVDKVNLVTQWRKRIDEFLKINILFPQKEDEKKRKKVKSIVGQIGAGKDNPNGIIDIAVMQSLYRNGEVKDSLKNYGMIIIDECHHISAFSFEQVLKSTDAKYIYGLTATPTRKDGHHPIIFMQCGQIRYRDDAKKQSEKRPFDHFIIPRFTDFRLSIDKKNEDTNISEIYAEIVNSEIRNDLIISDVLKCHESGRNCIVLTERTAHVEDLSNRLKEKIPDVVSLTGGMGAKETREIFIKLAGIPQEKPITIVATGKFIGEGFDEPRLDTLFLAMPISWKGTLQQYAGRLHRLYEGKKEVIIYDYVDIHIRMIEKMYNKRLSGYAGIGYKAKGEILDKESINIIFYKGNFLPVFNNDIINSAKEIVIVSPFLTKKRTLFMMNQFNIALKNNVKVIIITRPPEDFKNKDIDSTNEVLKLLKDYGATIVLKPNFHQKFAVIDKKIVWYGSINLLSFGGAEESIMRLESSNIANELIKCIED